MKSRFVKLAKGVLRPIRSSITNEYIERLLSARVRNIRETGVGDFDIEEFRAKVNRYINSVCDDKGGYLYRYSAKSTRPTLYASTYACLIEDLLGNLEDCKSEYKRSWCKYFDGFQSENDGLFYDPVTNNEIYAETDWWGARHLALHIVLAYAVLGGVPKYNFRFLDHYCKPGVIASWLDAYPWESDSISQTDIDNKIMNIGCLLQYERDRTGRSDMGCAVDELKKYLRSKINPQTSLWGGDDLSNPGQRSRMVQFAYHLLPIFFYDDDYNFDADKILSVVLNTQNRRGGYGVRPNSSACEDIDSLDLIIAFSSQEHTFANHVLKNSVSNAFPWILSNQVEDGGFVFRLFESFKYGHDETSSSSNQGAMFPTWFRLLSLIHAKNYLQGKQTTHAKHPGYYFLGASSC